MIYVVNKLMYEKKGKNHEFPETEKLQDTQVRKVVAIFPPTGGWR